MYDFLRTTELLTSGFCEWYQLLRSWIFISP